MGVGREWEQESHSRTPLLSRLPTIPSAHRVPTIDIDDDLVSAPNYLHVPVHGYTYAGISCFGFLILFAELLRISFARYTVLNPIQSTRSSAYTHKVTSGERLM